MNRVRRLQQTARPCLGSGIALQRLTIRMQRLIPELNREARNTLEITAVARHQGRRTHHTACGYAQIVGRPSYLLSPLLLQQRLRLLRERKDLQLEHVVQRLLK